MNMNNSIIEHSQNLTLIMIKLIYKHPIASGIEETFKSYHQCLFLSSFIAVLKANFIQLKKW